MVRDHPEGGAAAARCGEPAAVLRGHHNVLRAVDQEYRRLDRGDLLLGCDDVEPGSDLPLHVAKDRGYHHLWDAALDELLAHELAGVGEGPDGDDGANPRIVGGGIDGGGASDRQTQDSQSVRCHLRSAKGLVERRRMSRANLSIVA